MKRFLIILGLISMFLLGACATTPVGAEQTKPLKIWPHNDNGYVSTWCLVDEDTGVNYIVVTTELYSEADIGAITPRLNADGTLYVSP